MIRAMPLRRSVTSVVLIFGLAIAGAEYFWIARGHGRYAFLTLLAMPALALVLHRLITDPIERLLRYARSRSLGPPLLPPRMRGNELGQLELCLNAWMQQAASRRDDLIKLADYFANPVWRAGPDGECDYFNGAWLNFTGRRLEQLLGHGWLEDVHPEDRARCRTTWLEANSARRPFSMEYRLRHHSGGYHWISDQGQPCYGDEGEFQGFIGACYDLQHIRDADAALRESESRFRTLFEQAAVGVAQVEGATGRFVHVNQRYCDIVGLTREELLETPFEALTYQDDLAAHRERMRQLMSGETAEVRLEQRYRRRDGTLVWVNLTVSCMGEPRQGRGCCIVVVEDVSDRKEAERVLRQFQFMVEGSAEEIYLIGPGGELVYANSSAAKNLGYSVEELLAIGVSGFDPDFGTYFQEHLEDLKQADLGPFEATHVTRDGRRVVKEIKSAYVAVDGVEYVCAFARDITRRKRREERLRLAGKVFDAAREAIVVTDAERRIIAVNPAFTAMTGYRQEEVLGSDPKLLKSGRHDPNFYRAMWEELEREGCWRGEIWNARKNGDVFPVIQTVTEVRDDSGALVNYVGVATDISELKQAEQRVRNLAYYDPLTALPNRQLLMERAAFALAMEERQREECAVLFVDLDRFKYVNDSLGHQEGDALLKQVVARFKGIVRNTDTVSRLGGDEFVMLLPETGRDGALQVAEKIMAVLEAPCEIAGHSLSVTASIGISLFPNDGKTFDILLKNADTAMYRAKQEGRNAFRFYDADMNIATLEFLMLMSGLRRAIQQGELRTYFQPKIDLTDGRLAGAEALVRWDHPEHGLMLPGRFISAAERSDLIVSIGDWLLEDVCRHLVAWRKIGISPITVAVNIGARHFRDSQLAERVAELLARHELPPESLELELTESTILNAGPETIETLQQLREQGIRLVIDDFGTGYSSLAYLKNLPIAALKIDQSFVREVTSNSNDCALSAAFVALGHTLGLKIVAEGVETDEQREVLAGQGCDFAQGFLFSRPLPPDEFLRWRQNRAGGG